MVCGLKIYLSLYLNTECRIKNKAKSFVNVENKDILKKNRYKVDHAGSYCV